MAKPRTDSGPAAQDAHAARAAGPVWLISQAAGRYWRSGYDGLRPTSRDTRRCPVGSIYQFFEGKDISSRRWSRVSGADPQAGGEQLDAASAMRDHRGHSGCRWHRPFRRRRRRSCACSPAASRTPIRRPGAGPSPYAHPSPRSVFAEAFPRCRRRPRPDACGMSDITGRYLHLDRNKPGEGQAARGAEDRTVRISTPLRGFRVSRSFSVCIRPMQTMLGAQRLIRRRASMIARYLLRLDSRDEERWSV